MDTRFLDKVSPKNTTRIADILEIVVNELELQQLNRLKGNLIPWEYFYERGFSQTTVLAVLATIKEKFGDMYKVWNDNQEFIEGQLKFFGEPILISLYQEGSLKSWSEQEIQDKFQEKLDNILFSKLRMNLVLSLSNEQRNLLIELQTSIRKRLSIDEHKKTPTVDNKKFCWMENNNFHILRNDGTEGIMKFADEKGKEDMLNLFESIFDYWKENGKEEDGWIKIVTTRDEIRKRLKDKGLGDVTNDWISDTISNIRKNKITSDVRGYVSFDYFDRKLQGFPFKIKRAL